MSSPRETFASSPEVAGPVGVEQRSLDTFIHRHSLCRFHDRRDVTHDGWLKAEGVETRVSDALLTSGWPLDL